MDLQQIALALVLREAGVPMSTETFENRLILQKAAYLLQEAGVPLGYHFRWYLYGPYSPELRQDAAVITSANGKAEKELERVPLADRAAHVAKGMRSLLDGNELRQRAQKLELLASILFLIRTKQAPANNRGRIANVLHAFGKQFDEDQVEEGLNTLKKHGFAF